ncbi:LytTR family transcriptional regulator DNA-binding domain-containing protein [Paenibacillus alvei]|uniref:LytTR family transcriptional regulator DNA-binding domain-containing protein n=1 Tax=Paenibacillus alvei TaxID=44250 RepID=A0ABT4H6L1_PAEAL|nr:LytTR family transcriptional regulator DNA-binding domain-containing protein [Paenibacillus alvei]MCY9539861.1 LytTR family transcriptional regulator DNA-binding domain-containing protein [Paenibacillus alvei]MCY9708674.1 LytTR family transcriptional regulator DNA-binding domain-containing protein [Paenibacillus alvei]MCY9737259.1 LytTR family transcriptional regulator DNA-binding domain-containing protein [Paenibacillus alvei]MCY9758105.1 LytTR family transcriptional regulator DNA-binding d
MKFLVTIDPVGDKGITSVSVKNGLFLEYDKSVNKVVVHTKYNHYYMLPPTKYWVNGLNNGGFFYRFVERSNAVNIQNISSIDKKQRIIEFKGTTKTCTISRRLLKKILDEFPYLK